MVVPSRRHELPEESRPTPENVIGAFVLTGIVAERKLPDMSDPAMVELLVEGANLHLFHHGLPESANEATIIAAVTELQEVKI